MLKTLWKEWKDSAHNHNILFCFARIVPDSPHILGLIPCKSMTFSPCFRQALTFLMMSLTVSRRCWSFFMSRSMVLRE